MSALEETTTKEQPDEEAGGPAKKRARTEPAPVSEAEASDAAAPAPAPAPAPAQAGGFAAVAADEKTGFAAHTSGGFGSFGGASSGGFGGAPSGGFGGASSGGFGGFGGGGGFGAGFAAAAGEEKSGFAAAAGDSKGFGATGEEKTGFGASKPHDTSDSAFAAGGFGTAEAEAVATPAAVDASNGEEGDEELHKCRCKAFVLEKPKEGNAAWKERGVCVLKVLRDAKGALRVVARRELTHTLLLNAAPSAVDAHGDKAVRFLAASSKETAETFLVRVKTKDERASLLAVLAPEKAI